MWENTQWFLDVMHALDVKHARLLVSKSMIYPWVPGGYVYLHLDLIRGMEDCV